MRNPLLGQDGRCRRLLLLAFIVAASACQRALAADPPFATAEETHRPSVVPDRIILTLTSSPATSQAVTWRTSTDVEQGMAEFTRAEPGPGFAPKAQRVIAESQLLESNLSRAMYHTAVFNDLQPDTKYVYRVGDGGNWSEWFHFRTASASPQRFSFIYFGDAQNELHSLWPRVVREAFAEAPRASFLLHAGDLVNRGTRDQEWGDWHQAGGWVNATIPSLAAPGNHEYSRDAEDRPVITLHWRSQFAFPTNGPAGLEETAYYVDYQGTRIVVLNSNLRRDEQAEWLDQLLANNPCRWTIVSMHHPIYSAKSGRDNPELRAALQPIFDKHRVDLVLQGHDHTYARSKQMVGESGEANGGSADASRLREGGTVYVVSVSGPKMYDLGWVPLMRRGASGVQLFQIVTVDGEQLHFEARLATGELYDAFTLRKQSSGGLNELIERIPETPMRIIGVE